MERDEGVSQAMRAEGMYIHRMDVYRHSSMESGDRVSESGELLYENVPVRASKQTGLSRNGGRSHPRQRARKSENGERRYVLFHGTEVILEAGDEVRLKTDGRFMRERRTLFCMRIMRRR